MSTGRIGLRDHSCSVGPTTVRVLLGFLQKVLQSLNPKPQSLNPKLQGLSKGSKYRGKEHPEL